MISHHYTRSVKPSVTSHCFCSLAIQHWPWLPKLLLIVFYQAAKTQFFSATLSSNMLVMLNFKAKKYKYSKTDFTVELLRLWIIFIWYCIFWPLSYFCLTWTCPSKNNCNSFVSIVIHNPFGMQASVRLKQSWICWLTKLSTVSLLAN